MKKVLSIFLALAMLISLIPAVFAADAETESGIKVVNNFNNDKLGTDNVPVKELSYTASNGFWQYADDWEDRVAFSGTSGTGFRADATSYIKVKATLMSDTKTSAKVYEVKTDAAIGEYTFRYWVRGLENQSPRNRRLQPISCLSIHIRSLTQQTIYSFHLKSPGNLLTSTLLLLQ